MISKGELGFFNIIKDDCQVIFDVGCRTDTHYIDIKPEASFHLFEPNEDSFKEIKNKLSNTSSVVKLNNFGLGNKTDKIIYYGNTQSFCERTLGVYSDSSTIRYYDVKKFTEYIYENDITNISFLKIHSKL